MEFSVSTVFLEGDLRGDLLPLDQNLAYSLSVAVVPASFVVAPLVDTAAAVVP